MTHSEIWKSIESKHGPERRLRAMAEFAGHTHRDGDGYVATRGDQAEQRAVTFVYAIRDGARMRYEVSDQDAAGPA